MSKRILELLAPAKNLAYGLEAIRCGADALYIGAPRFGARSAATNTIEDIATLTKEAHRFGVKVFVTMNTILFEDELPDAKALALQLCGIGIDALIVQDMAYCTFNLPIPLHASTQAAALSVERIAFLKVVGFERVVLERASSLSEITEIHQRVNVELEAFVHGAICVSQSGQCYLGHALSGRSGNRGVCSQPCRARYNLVDENGNILLHDKHLLSLLDMNLSDSLKEMAEAGITSFKIEGRLKDISYLKNTILHYRKKLDELIATDNTFVRASWGTTKNSINTQLSKCFSRGATTYYLHSLQRGVASFDTAKAIGEYIGEVTGVKDYLFTIKNPSAELNNGDGICFIDKKGLFRGTNINIVDHDSIEPNKIEGIERGVFIYRNYDHQYTNTLLREKTERKIEAKISVTFSGNDIHFHASTTTGAEATITAANTFEEAKNKDAARGNIERSMTKSGDTIFDIQDVILEGTPSFIPTSELNAIRRGLLKKLTSEHEKIYQKGSFNVIIPSMMENDSISYKGNVTNSAARTFYTQCGVKEIEEGVELRESLEEIELMRTKYCILRETGECRKKTKRNDKLYLENGGRRLALSFDCKNCEMVVLWD